MIYVFLIILMIIELPFVFKFIRAKENFDITRQTAIVLIMLINAVFIFGLYKLILMIK